MKPANLALLTLALSLLLTAAYFVPRRIPPRLRANIRTLPMAVVVPGLVALLVLWTLFVAFGLLVILASR
jgi:hypothetical protein